MLPLSFQTGSDSKQNRVFWNGVWTVSVRHHLSDKTKVHELPLNTQWDIPTGWYLFRPSQFRNDTSASMLLKLLFGGTDPECVHFFPSGMFLLLYSLPDIKRLTHFLLTYHETVRRYAAGANRNNEIKKSAIRRIRWRTRIVIIFR